MADILLVEDELDLARSLTWSLENAGHRVRAAATGEEALRLADERAPDLVLLDLMLRGLGGEAVCRALRSNSSTREVSIIMVSARSEEIDRVVGFQVGADDYVTKPFSTKELLLRIDAVLRRGPVDEPETWSVGGLHVDAGAHRVTVDGEEIDLTATEFSLLRSLVSKPGRLLDRQELVRRVWSDAVAERTVDTTMKRLRRKLGNEGARIETLRGAGYRFRTDS